MASEQLRRIENTPADRDVHSEQNRERVPKMATHFDSLAQKAKQPNAGVARQAGDVNVTTGRDKQVEERRREPNIAVGKVQVSVVPGQERGASMESKPKHDSDKDRRRSTETAAERRNIDKGGGEKREQPSREEISKLGGTAPQNSVEKRAAEERYNKAKESVTQGLNTKEKGQQARETAQSATEKGGQATDTVRRAAEKGGQAKDTIVEGAKKTSQYIAEKGTETKDTAAETLSRAGRTTADYTVPKMEQAGEVAADMKDRAVVAGWNAAHYTTEKAVEGTKAAARMVEGAAEYAGQKSKELAATSLRAAKDSASAAGDTMKDYTARKKEEAARELEAKRSAEKQGEYIRYQEEEESKRRPSETRQQREDFPRKTKDKIEETGRERSSETRQQLEDFPRKTKERIEESGRERSSENRQQLEDFPRKTKERIEESGRERSSETRQQLEDFPRKNKEKIEETGTGRDGLKQSSQGSTERNKSGGFTQETEKRRHAHGGAGAVETEDVERRKLEGFAGRDDESQSGVLGAIAETIVEITQNTANLVNIAPDDDQPNAQSGRRRD